MCACGSSEVDLNVCARRRRAPVYVLTTRRHRLYTHSDLCCSILNGLVVCSGSCSVVSMIAYTRSPRLG